MQRRFDRARPIWWDALGLFCLVCAFVDVADIYAGVDDVNGFVSRVDTWWKRFMYEGTWTSEEAQLLKVLGLRNMETPPTMGWPREVIEDQEWRMALLLMAHVDSFITINKCTDLPKPNATREDNAATLRNCLDGNLDHLRHTLTTCKILIHGRSVGLFGESWWLLGKSTAYRCIHLIRPAEIMYANLGTPNSAPGSAKLTSSSLTWPELTPEQLGLHRCPNAPVARV